VSGGLDEEEILRLNPVADAYGVGTAISNAPVLNFAMDIVEVDGSPVAKRGKMSGRKEVFRCAACGQHSVVAAPAARPACCGAEMAPLLLPLIEDGRVVRAMSDVHALRRRVLADLTQVAL
jgi:nicotinate phosphoribosyltransferase